MRNSEQSSTICLLSDTPDFIDLYRVTPQSSLFSRKTRFDLIVLQTETTPYLWSSLSAFSEPFLNPFYSFSAGLIRTIGGSQVKGIW